ncbi:hypothetical protein AC579_9775 [Pseudocercospora musae]|uniref:Uncharacterized protein n=1 Tax=Pseudocercospora musae TaxID=113226 RepID=A0A139IG88_9PEZI|nr:hypothetical protein AC579_9775 [Pseudocercospora musae]
MADHAFVHVFALAAVAALLANHHISEEEKSRAWYLALVSLCPFLALEVAIWSFALYMGVQNAWLTTLQTLESFWTIIKTYPAAAGRDDAPFLSHSTATSLLDLCDALFVFLIVAVAGAAIYVSLLNPAQESDSRVSRNVSAARPHNAAEPSSNALPDAVAIGVEAVADQTSSPAEGPIRVTRENTSQPPEEAPSADDEPAPPFAPAPTSAQDPRFHTWLRRVDLPRGTRCNASPLLRDSDIWLIPMFPWGSEKIPKYQQMLKEQRQRIEDILRMRQEFPGEESDAKIAQKYPSAFYWPKSNSSTTTDRKEPNVFKSKTNDDRPREEPKTSKNTTHDGKAHDLASDSKDKPSNSHGMAEDGVSVPHSQNLEAAAHRTPAPSSQEVKSLLDETAEDSAVPKQQYEVPLDDIAKGSELAPSPPEAQRTEDAAVISASTIRSVENNSDQVAASEGYVSPKQKNQSDEKAAVPVSQSSSGLTPKQDSGINSKQDTEAISAGTIYGVENNSDYFVASKVYDLPNLKDQSEEKAAVAVPHTSSEITPDQGGSKGSEPAQTAQENQVNESEESSSAVDNVASAPTQNVNYTGGVDMGLRSAASSSGSNDSQGGQTSSLAQHQEVPVAAGNDDNRADIKMTDANADSELFNDAGEQHQAFASDDAMGILPLSSNGPSIVVQAGTSPVEHQIGATGGSPAGDVMNIDQAAVEQTVPAAPSLAQNLESHSEDQIANDAMDEDEEMPEVPSHDANQPTFASASDSQPSSLAPARTFTQPPQSFLFHAPVQMSMNGSNAFTGSVAAQQDSAAPMSNAAQNGPLQGVFAFNCPSQSSHFSSKPASLAPTFGTRPTVGDDRNDVNIFAPSGAPPGPFSTGSIGGASMSIPTAVQTAQQLGVDGSEQHSSDGSLRLFIPQQQSANTSRRPSLQSQAKPFKFDTSMLGLGNSSFGADQRTTERREHALYAANSATVVQSSLPRDDLQNIAAKSGQPDKDSQEGVAELVSAQAMQSQDVTPHDSGAHDSASQRTAPEAAPSEPSPRGPLHQEGHHVPVLGQHVPIESAAFEGSVLPRNILKATGPSRRRRAPATSSTASASSNSVLNHNQTKRQLDDDEYDVAAETSSSDELVRPEEPVRPYVRQAAPDHADQTKAQFADNRPIHPLKDYDIPFNLKLEYARKLMSKWYRELQAWRTHSSKTSKATILQALEQCREEVNQCYAFFDSNEATAHAVPTKKLTADDKVSDKQLSDLDTCLEYAGQLPEDMKAVRDALVEALEDLRKKMSDRRKQWVRDEREQNCQAPEPINDRPKWMREKVLATCKALVAEQKTALSVKEELKDPNSELQQDFLKTVNGWMNDLILFMQANPDEWNDVTRMSWGRYTVSLMRDMEAALRPIVKPVGEMHPFKISARNSNGLYELWDDIREGKVAQSLIEVQGAFWVAAAIPYPVSKGNLDNHSGSAKSNGRVKRGPIAGFMTSRTPAPTPEEEQLTIVRTSRPNVNGAATPSVGVASSSESNESQAHRLGQDMQSGVMTSPETSRGNLSPSHSRDMFPDHRNNALLTIEQGDPERERKENLIHQWLTHSSDSFRQIVLAGASNLSLEHVQRVADVLQNRFVALQIKIDRYRHFWIPDALLDPHTVFGKARASCRTLNGHLAQAVELVKNKLAEMKPEDAAYRELPEYLQRLRQNCSDLADADSCFKPEKGHSAISKTAAWPLMTVPGLQRYLFNRTISESSIRTDLSSNVVRGVRHDMENMDQSVAELVPLMRNHRQAWNDMANGVFGRRFIHIMAPFAVTLQNFLTPLFETGETGFEFMTRLLRNLQFIMNDLKPRHPNVV